MKIKILFENLGIRQTVFKNTFWLALAEGLSRFLKLALTVFIARILGATEYGTFTFAIAFASLFIIFSNLGLSQITTREFSQDSNKEGEFSALLSLKIILSFLVLFLIFISSLFITKDLLIRKIIWILSFYVLLINFPEIFYAFFRARQKMEYEALFKVIQALLLTVFSFFVIFKFPSIKNLSYSFLLSSLISLFLLSLFFYFKIFHLRINLQKEIWKKYLLLSWPLGLAMIFSTIAANFDSTILGHLKQITQNGWYNASKDIVDASLIPAVLVSQTFFPALSIALKNSKENLEKIWDNFIEVIFTLALPTIMGGVVLAPRIIKFLYPTYLPSILAFQILIIGAGISYLSFPLSQILIVFGQQKKILLITALGTLLNIILNLILIPKYSLYGAAISFILATLLSFLLFLKVTPLKFLNRKNFSNSFSVIISSLIMYFVISQPVVYYRNVFLSIFIGVVVYFIILFLSKRLLTKFLKFANIT